MVQPHCPTDVVMYCMRHQRMNSHQPIIRSATATISANASDAARERRQFHCRHFHCGICRRPTQAQHTDAGDALREATRFEHALPFANGPPDHMQLVS
jgi:hypothetical protein